MKCEQNENSIMATSRTLCQYSTDEIRNLIISVCHNKALFKFSAQCSIAELRGDTIYLSGDSAEVNEFNMEIPADRNNNLSVKFNFKNADRMKPHVVIEF